MTWYTTDREGWLTGESETPQPGATNHPPPAAQVAEPTPGELWPRWMRYGWALDVYPTPAAAPVAFAFDADGWLTGEVPVGTLASTRMRPDLLSTTTTPGQPRARWQAGAWTVQPYALPPRHINRRSFTNRFTQLEEAAVDLASIDNPSAPQQQRLQAAMLRAQRRKISDSAYVDLDLAQTRAGVQALEAGGLLAAGRALEILDAPIQPEERFAP